MTAEQKRLVQESFATLKPVSDLLGDIFYSRLFEVDPPLKHLFPVDNSQGEKLIEAVNEAVARLDCMETLEAAMQELGLLHAAHGARDHHYDAVEQALVWTLRMGMGHDAFTGDVRQAWVAVYGHLAAAMKRGAAREMVTF